MNQDPSSSRARIAFMAVRRSSDALSLKIPTVLECEDRRQLPGLGPGLAEKPAESRRTYIVFEKARYEMVGATQKPDIDAKWTSMSVICSAMAVQNEFDSASKLHVCEPKSAS